ncbi:hypothetical protein AA313_de0200346 [Arthrobotrys entomopaga]|nr:hypothetical protein AA313_de0200346 [Arthrobotrys entomopaga]
MASSSNSNPQTLKTGCNLCDNTDKLSRCAGCKVVQYCSRDHQTSDWPTHCPFCVKVKKSFKKFDEEYEKLRDHPGDWMTSARPFETSAGHFWGIHGTRDYMRARYAYIEQLLKIQTRAAVENAVENLMDMCRLCRGDNMGVRYLVPGCFLRLGRDQEAYGV